MAGTITSVQGFTALGKHIGIKKSKLDFAVIHSDTVCNAAAVYTRNKVKGAPLYVTKEHLKNGKAQAIIINSGVANVCTGKRGIGDARTMARLTAKELGISVSDVLVASTGIIGHYLPMDKIVKGVKNIKNELGKNSKVAQAILTTDKVKKEVFIKRKNFSIGAIAKGAGMVHPNMATMLAFICTDADIPSKKLKQMLKKSTEISFNMLTVDMDTSTSDMCILLANGKAGKADEKSFQKALDEVCISLARMIVRDGEGATKLIEVHIKNMANEEGARKLAKAVVSSNLVKCAAYGNDPNWGRILCAMGNSGVEFNPLMVEVHIGPIMIVRKGVPVDFDYSKVKKAMHTDALHITINMHAGPHSATAYGCDMTEEYININAHYHT